MGSVKGEESDRTWFIGKVLNHAYLIANVSKRNSPREK